MKSHGIQQNHHSGGWFTHCLLLAYLLFMVLHKRRSWEQIRARITVFIIDVIHNGLNSRWYHKVRVPCNLSLDLLLVYISLLFDLIWIVENSKCLFQAGVELHPSLTLLLLLYSSLYILVTYMFPPLFWLDISNRPAISTGYWCLSLQGRYVLVLLVCKYGQDEVFIGRILLQQSKMAMEILYSACILCGP